MRVFRARDIPDSHKIAVYDALCVHFSEALDRYYTDLVPQDPRYDSGVTNEESWCMIEVEGAWANVIMSIPGRADTIGFSVKLPLLGRDDQTDEGSWIDVSEPRAPDAA